MNRLILKYSFLLVLLSLNIGYSQVFIDTSAMTIIQNNRTAAEGDMYLDTINNVLRIGLTHGRLGFIGDNQKIDSIRMVGDSALSIYLERGGSDTVSLSALSDNDWYKIGTTSSPKNISDSLYTGGDVQITNYPNTRADDTSSYLNTLYTDLNGNIKSGRREITPPTAFIDATTLNSSNTFNYYNHYSVQITNAGLTPIPVTSLDFYIYSFDPAVFSNVSIIALGVLTYDVIATSTTKTFIDVRFFTK